MSAIADPIHILQDWYASQCNGRWEHGYGVSIATLDSPGWAFKANLDDTALAGRRFDDVQFDGEHPHDWYTCAVRGNFFESACGPNHLRTVIDLFLKWANEEPLRA